MTNSLSKVAISVCALLTVPSAGLKTQQEDMKKTLDQRLNERLSTFKQRATKEKAETAKVFLAKYKTLKEEHRTQQQVYNENRQKNIEEIFAAQVCALTPRD